MRLSGFAVWSVFALCASFPLQAQTVSESASVDLQSDEVRARLAPHQYQVACEGGTEPAFSGEYWDHHEDGGYLCVVCGAPLFDSDTKFDSGTGWPSFTEPVSSEAVAERVDESHGMVRTEVVCRRCGAHLGHVFDDGPAPNGLRYCVNSASLDFVPREEQASPETKTQTKGPATAAELEEATFGGGCFWHVEETFRTTPGVVSTEVGYAGGTMPNPTYHDVCSDTTGHAEVVHLVFDPSQVSYEDLLDIFWRVHDPTQVNRQGPDVGTQYRTVIFYHTPEQQQAATASRDQLAQSGRHGEPIATAIEPATQFWRAEEYHQQYFLKNGIACGPLSAP